MTHPDRERVEALAHDALESHEAEAVRAHVRACGPCADAERSFHEEAGVLRDLLSVGPRPARRRWTMLAPAAALLVAAGVIALIFASTRPASKATPADTGRPRAPDSVERLVAQWLAGGDVEDSIVALGRKALPALEAKRGERRVAALVERLRARPVRVLYIEGMPRYEYRYLKHALIRDKELLVHVFLTSADEDFPQEHSQGAKEPEFAKGVKAIPADLQDRYDVLIVGDVAPAKLPSEGLLRFAREFGGGIVWSAGEAHHADLMGGVLSPLFPVKPAADDVAPLPGWGPGVTLAARKHAIGRIPFEPAPGGWLADAEAKAGATTLLEARYDGQKRPLCVIQDSGHGRVLWTGTDSTWKWRWETGDQPIFYPFWRAAIDSVTRP